MSTMDRGNFDNISSPISFEVVKNSFTTKLFLKSSRLQQNTKNEPESCALKKGHKKGHVTVFFCFYQTRNIRGENIWLPVLCSARLENLCALY